MYGDDDDVIWSWDQLSEVARTGRGISSPRGAMALLSADGRQLCSFWSCTRSMERHYNEKIGSVLNRKWEYDYKVGANENVQWKQPLPQPELFSITPFPLQLVGSVIAGAASAVSSAVAWTRTPYPTITVEETQQVVDALMWQSETHRNLVRRWNEAYDHKEEQWAAQKWWKRWAQCLCRACDATPRRWQWTNTTVADTKDLNWLVQVTVQREEEVMPHRAQLQRLSLLLAPALLATLLVCKFNLNTECTRSGFVPEAVIHRRPPARNPLYE